MWDITRIALGTRNRLEVFDRTKSSIDENFSRYNYDSPSEILCVKFLNSNRLVFSDGNFSLKLKDLNRDIQIFKFQTIERKFLTIDFDPSKEPIVFLGSDKSTVSVKAETCFLPALRCPALLSFSDPALSYT